MPFHVQANIGPPPCARRSIEAWVRRGADFARGREASAAGRDDGLGLRRMIEAATEARKEEKVRELTSGRAQSVQLAELLMMAQYLGIGTPPRHTHT